MKITRFLAAAFVAACFAVTSAFAAAKPEGTWSWSQPGRDPGTMITYTLKVESKDGQLKGALSNVNGSIEIKDLAVKDDVISFEVAGRRGGATKYSGKLSADKITGTIEIPARSGGEPKTIEWAAKHADKV